MTSILSWLCPNFLYLLVLPLLWILLFVELFGFSYRFLLLFYSFFLFAPSLSICSVRRWPKHGIRAVVIPFEVLDNYWAQNLLHSSLPVLNRPPLRHLWISRPCLPPGFELYLMLGSHHKAAWGCLDIFCCPPWCCQEGVYAHRQVGASSCCEESQTPAPWEGFRPTLEALGTLMVTNESLLGSLKGCIGGALRRQGRVVWLPLWGWGQRFKRCWSRGGWHESRGGSGGGGYERGLHRVQGGGGHERSRHSFVDWLRAWEHLAATWWLSLVFNVWQVLNLLGRKSDWLVVQLLESHQEGLDGWAGSGGQEDPAVQVCLGGRAPSGGQEVPVVKVGLGGRAPVVQVCLGGCGAPAPGEAVRSTAGTEMAHLSKVWFEYQIALIVTHCITRAPCLLLRSWVALSFKVCLWVRYQTISETRINRQIM